ncbi:phosphotyrosine protein phosphatase I superfamily [Aspergillus germanicus]
MSNKPTVLFVCIHNAGRSQMAAGYLTHLAGKTIDVLSAGSAPASSINPRVVEAMLEEGIDLANEIPKVLTVDSRYLDWKLDDPAGQGLDAVRVVRDEIRRLVEGLIGELRPSVGV